MFYQFMILEIFPLYTIIVWFIRVTARNGSEHLKKPKKKVFSIPRYPPTLRAKSSIKEKTDLVNLFLCMFNQNIFRLKVMYFRTYKGSKLEIFSNVLPVCFFFFVVFFLNL